MDGNWRNNPPTNFFYIKKNTNYKFLVFNGTLMNTHKILK